MAKLRIMVQAFVDGKWLDRTTVPLTERGQDRPFSSGAIGYNGNDKVMLPPAGGAAGADETQHQFTLNLIQVGSGKAKEAK